MFALQARKLTADMEQQSAAEAAEPSLPQLRADKGTGAGISKDELLSLLHGAHSSETDSASGQQSTAALQPAQGIAMSDITHDAQRAVETSAKVQRMLDPDLNSTAMPASVQSAGSSLPAMQPERRADNSCDTEHVPKANQLQAQHQGSHISGEVKLYSSQSWEQI